MKKLFAFSFILFLVMHVFADQKPKTLTGAELDEKSRLAFDYSFVEGIKFKMIGHSEEALRSFEKCLKILPSSPVVQFEMADIFLNNNDLDKALQYAKESVSGNSSNIWYKILLATIYQKKSMIDDACQVYEEIVDKYSSREEFYFTEASLYISIENWEKAIEVYNRYEKQFGITELVSIEKAKIYIRLKDHKKASNELLKLIRKYPDRNEYINLLADLYFNSDQEKKGLQILDRLLKANPENGYLNFYIADYYREKKEWDLADKYAKSALLNDYVNCGLKVQYVLKLILESDYEKTGSNRWNEYIHLLVQNYRDDISVRTLYSDFLKKENKLPEAKKELEYILSKDKSNFAIWEELLLICNELSDTNSMQKNSIEAIKYFPDEPLPYALAGFSFCMLNDLNTAITYFEKGLNLVDHKMILKSQFYAYLADCYYQLDSIEKAFHIYDKALLLNPNDVQVLNNYAYYLALHNRSLSMAEKMSLQAVSLEPDNSNFIDTYAWVLYKRGDYMMAKFYIKMAIEKSKDPSAVLYEHYGDILYRNGEIEQAKEMWKKALEIGTEISENLKQKVETGVLKE